MVRRVGVLLVVLGSLALRLASPAPAVVAQATVVTADPAPDAVLNPVPAEVRLVFAEPVTDTSVIIVLGPDGAVVSGPTTVAGDTAWTAVRASGPGVYEVQWATVSAEGGQAAAGTFHFTVAG